MNCTTTSEREAMMGSDDGQNKENPLRLVRGGRYAERPARIFTTGEIKLDADMASLMDAVVGSNGKAPTRGFARAGRYGELHPHRILARYIVAAARSCAREDQILAITERLTAFAREQFNKYHGRRHAA